MTDKKLYEMTPEEHAALTKDELEEKVFEMQIEGASDRVKYIYITAREKEKSLPESLKPFKFSRFFFCDLYEGAKTVERIRSAAVESSGTIQDIYYSTIDTILDYASYYAEIFGYDAEQIAQDLIAFVKTLEFVPYKNPENESEGVYLAYPGGEQDSIEGSFYGWAIFNDKTPPTSLFEKAYSLITAASEIALHALLDAKAPREAFTAVYSAFVEKITQTIPAPENVKDYAEHNARFDKMYEQLKAPESKDNAETIEGQVTFEELEAPPKKKHPSIGGRRPSVIPWDITKISQEIFRGKVAGNIKDLPLDTSKPTAKDPINIYVSVLFNELDNPSRPELREILKNIERRLTPFDKFVYAAVCALWISGNTHITVKQIAHVLFEGETGSNNYKKILDSLYKMQHTVISIDNSEEIAHKYRYPLFVRTFNLLPAIIDAAYMNGQLAEAAFNLIGEPPLYTFARDRGQLSEFAPVLFVLPFNHTELNDRIADYIMTAIKQMKTGHRKKRILWETLYTNIGTASRMDKTRIKQRVCVLLDRYKIQKEIKGFTPDQKGINISV